VDAGFYSVWSYIASVVLMHMPLAMVEVLIFATPLYYMSDMVDDAERWCGDDTRTRTRMHTHA